MMRIDAHQHFWRIADHKGGWPPPEQATLHRDRLPEDLAPLLARHGVEATVLVQSLPNEDDTRWMLDLAGRHAFIAGVVGWVDLKGKDAPQRIAALALDPRLVGLRPMLQDLDDDWIDDAALEPAVQAMAAHHLVLDALVRPRQLRALLGFAKRFPCLPVVIDHGAKPGISNGELEPWRHAMARLATLPQVVCKLSGLVTEAGTGWDLERLRPYVDHILECFGTQRVIWGSDWPVLDLASDYDGWVAASEALLAGLPATQRNDIFGANARRFYGLDNNYCR
jgi:L-fuconolactonase